MFFRNSCRCLFLNALNDDVPASSVMLRLQIVG